jgi:hypothetical protein
MEELLNVVVTRLAYLSLGPGLCVFITIFKSISFVVGYMSLSFIAILKHTTCNFLGYLCYVSLLHLVDFVLGHMFLNFCCHFETHNSV